VKVLPSLTGNDCAKAAYLSEALLNVLKATVFVLSEIGQMKLKTMSYHTRECPAIAEKGAVE